MLYSQCLLLPQRTCTDLCAPLMHQVLSVFSSKESKSCIFALKRERRRRKNQYVHRRATRGMRCHGIGWPARRQGCRHMPTLDLAALLVHTAASFPSAHPRPLLAPIIPEAMPLPRPLLVLALPLLLATAFEPLSCWARSLPSRRSLQQQAGQQQAPDSSAASPYYEAEPRPVTGEASVAGGSYQAAAAPGAEGAESTAGPQLSSPYRFSDVGSSSAAAVAEAIAAGDAARFAATAASAGPEAAGRAVTEAVTRGQGGLLASLVNNAGGDPAAADALLTVRGSAGKGRGDAAARQGWPMSCTLCSCTTRAMPALEGAMPAFEGQQSCPPYAATLL